MATVIAGMTLSLDGYGADDDGNVDRLYADFAEYAQSAAMAAAVARTGAVVMGRRTFEMGNADSYVGNYEFQVPIFVVTTHPPDRPPKQDDRLTFTFVDDGVESAISQACVAARAKDVQVVGGASVIRQGLLAEFIDELHIDIVPVLLGGGLRLFDQLDVDKVPLETIGVETIGQRTALRYRVGR